MDNLQNININIESILYLYLGKTIDSEDQSDKKENLRKIKYLKFIKNFDLLNQSNESFNNKFWMLSKHLRNYLAHDYNYKATNENKTNAQILLESIANFLDFWKENDYFSNLKIEKYVTCIEKNL